ncbi:MAG: methyltransferase [Myxococcota bacterium]
MARTRLTNKPDTRDRDASTVLLDALPALEPGARVLVIDDQNQMVRTDLRNRRVAAVPWSRVSVDNRQGTPWPVGGPYDAATLRLPRSKDAFEMALHAAASVLKPGAPLWVYGANDEGIKSARTRIKPLYGEILVLDARKHCRALEANRPDPIPDLKPSLADFRTVSALDLPEGPIEHALYPGMFAKGRLDEGTRALLDILPEMTGTPQVLDFACGAGVIGGAIQRRCPSAEIWMSDADAVAVEAAKENVPTAQVVCGDAWQPLPAIRHFDYIFSNPPIHTGKGRDYTTLSALINDAPGRMVTKGELWIVTQRQIPVEGLLEARYATVQLIWEDTRFRVWSASAPRKAFSPG